MHNWNPDSRVFQFAERHGPGLEHIALETDAIESEVGRLRELGVLLFEDRIVDANDGYEAFVFPENAVGFTVELIQPHPHSWGYPEEARRRRVSETLGAVKLQHVGAMVRDVEAAARRLERLFGVSANPREARVELGNAWLQLMEGAEEGLDHIALETTTLEQDVRYLRRQSVRLIQDKKCPGGEGESVFVFPDAPTGLALELSAGRRGS